MKDFHQAQWNFFKEKGFDFFIRDNYHVEAHPKGSTSKMFVVAVKNFDEFERFFKTKMEIYISNQKELNLIFFLEYYKKSENKNFLLDVYDSICDTPISQGYLNICDYMCSNNAEKIQFIKNLPTNFLWAKHIKIPVLQTYLKLHKIDDETEERLIFDLLKARKSQIKNPDVYANIKPFLKSKYSYEQLEKYFPFFPALKADFEEVDIDIFETKNKISTFTHVNLRDVVTRFGISDWKATKYYDCINELCEGLKTLYDLDNYHISFTNKPKQIIGISFSHKNKKFDKEVLTNGILDYLNHLKFNSEKKEDIVAWLMQEKLNNGLTEKLNSKPLPLMKI